MKRAYVIVLAVVVVVVAGGAVLLANNNGNDKMDMDMSSKTSTNTDKTPTATNKVSIANFAFSPAAITVKVGTTVTWANSDSVTHTVTADDGNGPDSGNLAPGDTYSFTFKAAGTYKYHCAIHASMTGTVVVTE